MPDNERAGSQIVSVRLPADLLERLDRYLDWRDTTQRRKSTRNAALRQALSAWLDQQEQQAGLVESHTLRRHLQDSYTRLSPRRDWVLIHQLRRQLHWPQERFDTVVEALRADQQVELDSLAPAAMTAQALQESYHVHGHLYLRLKWRDAPDHAPA
jgi:hypothetical protein